MKKQNNIFWIAFVNRLPVGYKTETAFLFRIYRIKGHLPAAENLRSERLSVNENRIELQDSLLKKPSNWFQKVWLSVLNSNERAINFYKKRV